MAAHGIVLVDTGPLVALLDERDCHHEWAKARFRELHPPLWTCEAVCSETWFLLRKISPSQSAFVRLWQCGILKLRRSLESQLPVIWDLLQGYADVPMGFADACLIRMSEIDYDCRVWTVDEDFRRYRRRGREVIPLIFPES